MRRDPYQSPADGKRDKSHLENFSKEGNKKLLQAREFHFWHDRKRPVGVHFSSHETCERKISSSDFNPESAERNKLYLVCFVTLFYCKNKHFSLMQFHKSRSHYS